MELSATQEDAVEKILRWLERRDPTKPIFRLAGYAGTGKTTLARVVAEQYSGTVFCAYSGKAAQVLESKGIPATTIHSLIYALKDEKVDEATGETDLEFKLKASSTVKRARLIAVDEASMCDDATARDLLRFGKPILAMGDPFQLPPVKGAGSLMSGPPDVLLEEIHRQARDNPIIKLSMQIRHGEFYPRVGDFGPLRIVRMSQMRRSDLASYDTVICGRNSTRERMNREMRAFHGYTSPMPEKGETLIAMKSFPKPRVVNGETFTVVKARPTKEWGLDVYQIVATSTHTGKATTMSVPVACFDGREAELSPDDRKTFPMLAFAYAITGHKAQGSQWPGVAVLNESAIFRREGEADHSAQWLYTAVTRAADRLLLGI